jgi:hypothetical protein
MKAAIQQTFMPPANPQPQPDAAPVAPAETPPAE